MFTNKLLTTKDIRKMSLREFMSCYYSIPKYQLVPVWQLQDANSDWLIINHLEHKKTIKELMADKDKEPWHYILENPMVIDEPLHI